MRTELHDGSGGGITYEDSIRHHNFLLVERESAIKKYITIVVKVCTKIVASFF